MHDSQYPISYLLSAFRRAEGYSNAGDGFHENLEEQTITPPSKAEGGFTASFLIAHHPSGTRVN